MEENKFDTVKNGGSKNSIEEDIKNIEEIIELSKEEIDAKDENITAILDIEDLISLEHILSDYKKILKENEELKSQEETARKVNELLVERYSTSIPVQIVKDKIEELNRRIEIYRKYVKQGVETDVEWVDNVADRETVKVLQELIEESSEK